MWSLLYVNGRIEPQMQIAQSAASLRICAGATTETGLFDWGMGKERITQNICTMI